MYFIVSYKFEDPDSCEAFSVSFENSYIRFAVKYKDIDTYNLWSQYCKFVSILHDERVYHKVHSASLSLFFFSLSLCPVQDVVQILGIYLNIQYM